MGHEPYVGKLAIPYLTPTGVIDIRFRSLNSDGGPKYMSRPGATTHIYNINALSNDSDVLAICEGELDTVVATQAGFSAVGLPGANNWKSFYNRVLADWSNILQVEKPPVIFNGYLTGLQKEKILEYLSTPEKDLDNIFNSQSFTRYIISILNPDLRTSALMNDIDKPIEGIVFKFITPGENEVYSARLIDPIFQAHASSVQQPIQRRSNDIYQIAMLDIIEYVEMLKLLAGCMLNYPVPKQQE
jgi:hypothetical protein